MSEFVFGFLILMVDLVRDIGSCWMSGGLLNKNIFWWMVVLGVLFRLLFMLMRVSLCLSWCGGGLMELLWRVV